MDHHREVMELFLEELANSKTSPVLKDDKYNAIIEVLKDPNACKDTFFKFKVKSKKYQIMDLPGLGIKNALVVPVKESKTSGVRNVSSAFLRVLPQSQVYDVMHEIHCRELNHAGYKKCRDYVSMPLF